MRTKRKTAVSSPSAALNHGMSRQTRRESSVTLRASSQRLLIPGKTTRLWLPTRPPEDGLACTPRNERCTSWRVVTIMKGGDLAYNAVRVWRHDQVPLRRRGVGRSALYPESTSTMPCCPMHFAVARNVHGVKTRGHCEWICMSTVFYPSSLSRTPALKSPTSLGSRGCTDAHLAHPFTTDQAQAHHLPAHQPTTHSC